MQNPRLYSEEQRKQDSLTKNEPNIKTYFFIASSAVPKENKSPRFVQFKGSQNQHLPAAAINV